jgi:hypothetical protein
MRRWVACGLVLALAAAGWYWLEHRPGSGITAENADRIEPGMTAAEVETILGCPAGVYSDRERSFLSRRSLKIIALSLEGPPPVTRWWVGAAGTVEVVFDGEDDTVLRSEYHPPEVVTLADWIAYLLEQTGLR